MLQLARYGKGVWRAWVGFMWLFPDFVSVGRPWRAAIEHQPSHDVDFAMFQPFFLARIIYEKL